MRRIDSVDLKIFKERKNEETISFESFIKKLRLKGKFCSHAEHGNKCKK